MVSAIVRFLAGWKNMSVVIGQCRIVFRAMEELHSGFSCLELVYEDRIEHDPRMAYHDVLSFLELPIVDVEIRQQKINHGRLTDLISNYDDVQKLPVFDSLCLDVK